MVQRGVTPQEVAAVIAKPDRIESSVKGRMNAFGPGARGIIRVTFREMADEYLIVTVVRQGGVGRGKA
jgi:hypothetical protein